MVTGTLHEDTPMATCTLSAPRFAHGRLVMTPSVRNLLRERRLDVLGFLQRHLNGDWGDLSDEDRQSNETALRAGDRLFSSYTVDSSVKLWIITEADRSVTTLLLPQDY
jgi:hypothetical protein